MVLALANRELGDAAPAAGGDGAGDAGVDRAAALRGRACSRSVVGMVIGYLLEWLREHKHRRRASQKAREAARLNAEVDRLRKADRQARGRRAGAARPLRRGCGSRSAACGRGPRSAAAVGGGGGLRRARPLSALAAAPVARRRPLGRRRRCPTGVIRVALTVDASDAAPRGAASRRCRSTCCSCTAARPRSGWPRSATRFGRAGDEGGRDRRPRPIWRRSTPTPRSPTSSSSTRGRRAAPTGPAATASPSTGG